MIAKLTLVLFAGGLLAQQTNWFQEGNRALDQGKPEEAAADYVQELKTLTLGGAPGRDLVRVRVSLVAAYIETGAYRDMEAVLQEAQKSAPELTDALTRAQLLNAWSALHQHRGQLSAAEAELHEALRIATDLPNAADLPGTALHNLATVEARTGRYPAALAHEIEAVRRLESTLPPDHPTLIRVWGTLAAIQYMTNDAAEAKVSIEHAIRAAEDAYGPRYPLLADLLTSEAVVLDRLKLHRDARRARAQAAAISKSEARAADRRLTWDIREPWAPGHAYLSSK
jgi:tetratricopeptide (TPR) repeat protein